MKRVLQTIMLLTIFSSCSIFNYTQKKAERQVTRAQATFPAVVANGCGNWYPPRIETVTNTLYKQGKDTVIHDTLKVKCPDDASGNPQYVDVPVPEYSRRVDTFFSERVIEKENTAKVSALADQLKEMTAAKIEFEVAASTWRTLTIIIGSLFIILLIFTLKKS